MKYIHVKNIEKYHPGYKDRDLSWCKILFTMVGVDQEFVSIEREEDKWRFIVLIILELQNKKPLLYDEKYLRNAGNLSLKKRPFGATLKSLKKFIEIIEIDENSAENIANSVTENPKVCNRTLPEPEKICNVERERKSLESLKDLSLETSLGFSKAKTIVTNLKLESTDEQTIREILEHFCHKYQESFGMIYPLAPKREKEIVQNLLKTQSKNILIDSIDHLFRLKDTKKGKWLKDKMTISTFAYKLPEILPKLIGKG